MEDTPKPFLNHLEDLRWMLIKSMIALIIAMIVSTVFANTILDFLEAPLQVICDQKHLDIKNFLITLHPVDPLTITLKTGLFAGIILSCPFLFYFIGQFVLPALHVHERKALLPAFAIGGILFLAGATFCYFLVIPMTLSFFIDWGSSMNLQAQWPLNFYIGFVLQLLAAFGVSFELPLVIVILAKLGIVTHAFLAHYRRHAALIFMIFAACITPTSDPFTLCMLFVPLYLLYEAGVFATLLIERARPKEDI